MKKIKQILALLGVLLLVSLYLITLLCAIFDNSNTMQLFQASILATIIIPVLLWAYSFIYRLLKNHDDSGEGKDKGGNAGMPRG
jgi:dolichyl-phosphate-mannose--protein O-mannosyl transferase